MSVSAGSVLIDVRGMQLSVHPCFVDCCVQRPACWGIVRRPPDAVMIPESWGAWYAVCPGCAARQPIEQVSGTMPCAECGEGFEITWRREATPTELPDGYSGLASDAALAQPR